MNRSEIYKPLRDYAREKMPFLKFIDLEKGQMKNPQQNYPVPLPALFIEIGDFRFSNYSQHRQKGEGLISFYLYCDLQSDSYEGAEREEQTIEILDQFDQIFETFEGVQIYENMSPLVRQTEWKPQYGTRQVMFRTDFSMAILDQKTPKQTTPVMPALQIFKDSEL